MSISGSALLKGDKNLSISSPYLTGSRPDIPKVKLTKLPAPDPLAATRIPICLVKSTTSPTVKK